MSLEERLQAHGKLLSENTEATKALTEAILAAGGEDKPKAKKTSTKKAASKKAAAKPPVDKKPPKVEAPVIPMLPITPEESTAATPSSACASSTEVPPPTPAPAPTPATAPVSTSPVVESVIEPKTEPEPEPTPEPTGGDPVQEEAGEWYIYAMNLLTNYAQQTGQPELGQQLAEKHGITDMSLADEFQCYDLAQELESLINTEEG